MKYLFALIGVALVLAGVVVLGGWRKNLQDKQGPTVVPTPPIAVVPTPSVSPTPTPVPPPDPKVYGPCKNVPVVLYHHVQPNEDAAAKSQTKISVDNDVFVEQTVYLKNRGYNTITPDQLLSGLTSGLPAKPILLTFDDGYRDFYKYAYPELVKNGLQATVFLSVGHVGGDDYLTWEQIVEMKKSGLVTFGNHTWSHKNLGPADQTTARTEITMAQSQLEKMGVGPITTFAYPYGAQNGFAEKVLHDLGIKTAFTTIPGNTQCAKLPYAMRRSRIGSVPLSYYGF